MKTTKLILSLVMAMAVTATASAQFANAGGSSKSSKSGSKGGSILYNDTENYQRVYVGVNPLTIKTDAKDAKDVSLTSFGAGYTYGLNLTEKLPLFLEMGANFAYGIGSEKTDYAKVNYSAMYVQVPVSVAYKLSFLDGKLGVTPFFGINFRVNILGQTESKYEYRDDTVKSNWFSKDDMGDDPYGRFQMGWQLGVGLNYKSIYLGVGGGTDFMEIAKKATVHSVYIQLGYTF